jgi:hypothetical protein
MNLPTVAPVNLRAWERRVFIFGSRPPAGSDPADWAVYWSMLHAVDDLVDELPDDVLVVSGGARGTDQHALQRARRRGLATHVAWPMERRRGVYRVRYTLTPAGGPMAAHVWWDAREVGTWAIAAYRRNGYMVDVSTEAHGFRLGGSRGTGHAMDLAEWAGKLRTRIEL